MRNGLRRFGFLLAFALFAVSASAAEQDWVKKSNENSMLVVQSIARFNPESAQQLGAEGFDEQIIDLNPHVYERLLKDMQTVRAELEKRAKTEKDPRVLQDLEILTQGIDDNIHSVELQHKYMLPYAGLPQTLFNGLRALLDPQIPKERQQAAVERVRKYAGLAKGYKPITELAEARTEERMDKGLLGPYKGEVEQDLGNTPRFMGGIRKLFENSGLDGWQEPLTTLEGQVQGYTDWVKSTILPLARDDYRQPPEIYADNLKQFGVDRSPEELIERATASFMEIRDEMRALAPQVAKERGLKTTDYHEVIKALKSKQITGDDVMPFFKKRLSEIEDIVRRERIVTIPEREAQIRLATEAETANQPAPHLDLPRLIGNTGEYATFVLPLNVPKEDGTSALPYDDFTNDAAAWTLTVHEARPGHELQFSSMLEHGVSIARAVFAFNSVNVEGWALYAEAVMKPYLPLDGQMMSLQARLMRAARAFLDPMLNLGMITPDQARSFLMDEVVLSEAMAKQEVDRYTFRLPGQATSYFYGYKRLESLRTKTQLALRDRFNLQEYHDFILSQGLLPPDLLQKAVMEQFIPEHQKPTAH